MAYDVLIFFFYFIILLGMIGSFFLVLKNAFNVDDAIRIDPKLQHSKVNEHSQL